MRRRRFAQVDVFASRPTKGNGLAVVLDAGDLSAEEMQGFAAWTNLAETTFLRPPDDASADYAVRIFTPGREMPFAGHPTLGSCAAWLDAGGVPRSEGRVVQECAIGLVDIHLGGDVPAFVAPETEVAALSEDEVASLCDALAVARRDVVRAARLANGPVWQVLELASAEAVLAVDAARVRWPEHVGVSVLGAHREGAECDYEVRSLSPSSGMSEDPITGSLNAAIAWWMASEGRLSRDLTIAQGTKLGREGRVFVRRATDGSGQVLIGGESRIVVTGTATF